MITQRLDLLGIQAVEYSLFSRSGALIPNIQDRITKSLRYYDMSMAIIVGFEQWTLNTHMGYWATHNGPDGEI